MIVRPGNSAWRLLFDSREIVEHSLIEGVQAKTGCKVDWDKAREFVEFAANEPSDDGFILYAGGCFVLLSIGSAWYTNEKYLYEDFIIAVEPTDFRALADALAALASDMGAVGIIVGTLAQHREKAYGRLLERVGFRKVASEYFKEI